MSSYRLRYAGRKKFVADESSAVGYIHYLDSPDVPIIRNDDYRSQYNSIRRFAKARRLKLWRTFRDTYDKAPPAVLGKKGLRQLFQEIEVRQIKTVIVSAPERFVVDPNTIAGLLRLLASRGVTVFAAATGHDLSSSVQVKGSISSSDVVALKRFLTRLKTGRTSGRRPYGTSPGEKRVLDRMLSLIRKRHSRGPSRPSRQRRSRGEIARILNDEGYSTRSGKPWTASTVKSVLRTARPKLFFSNWPDERW